MTDETPQSEGEPSPAVPDETPTAETTPFTYDDAVTASGEADDAAPAAPDPDATQATPVAPVAPAAAAPVAAAPATTTVTEDRPSGIFIPKWVGIVAAAIIAALVFGGIGYAIGDSSSDSNTQNASALPGTVNGGNGNNQLPNGNQFPGGQFPGGNNNGNGNDNGGGTGNGQTASDAGFLGVGVQEGNGGVEVTDVASDSPASDAGLKQGDVITAVDDTKVTTPLALRTAVQKHSSGDEITVTYTRDGSSSTAKVTLTSRPSQSS